ncbi:MAG: TAT-variant-translocated molybdopterin oxidoreductase [Bacteroidota bacterium]|nr:TAT-variant-translocated molybdopterin oxidoreductase [Bacteroidota bacterium]
MLENNKTYWKGIEELTQTPEFVANAKQEFPDYLPSESENGGHYRRDFLKLMGFGVAAATLAACETPVRKAIPYLNKPEEIDPSMPNYYASTYIDGGDYCSIVVKTREGRPIKIEGNKNSSISQGGLSARVAASVLSLYDKARFTAPQIKGANVSWDELDGKVAEKLKGKIAVVSNTVLSPSLQQCINEFVVKYPGSVHVSYDPNSASGIIEANEKSFGVSALPSYDFSKASVIVSFGADFLGTWLSPIEFNKQYSKTRKLGKSKKEMSRHYQFESLMSLTGANADFRTAIKPSQEGLVISNLYNLIASKSGAATIAVGEVKDIKFLQKAADDLLNAKGKSLVVSGSNDTNVQLVVNAINNLLGNYGVTVNSSIPTFNRKGKDADFKKFVSDLKNGGYNGVIFLNCNPIYDSAFSTELKSALANVDLKVAISDKPNETTAVVDFVAADNHFLESWTDANPKKGCYSLGQPTISPLFKTRQAIDTILKWTGSNATAYDYIKTYWSTNLFPLQSEKSSFQSFWDNTLHNGVFEISSSSTVSYSFDITSVSSIISSTYKSASQDIEYVIYEKVGMGVGSQANNPWLQELPEPISKACWDNYVTVSQKFANEKGLAQGDLVKIDSKTGKSITLPVLIQPGQAQNTIAFAMGYGRTVAGKVGNNVGQNVFPFVNINSTTASFTGSIAAITKTGETREIAQTQTHHTMMSRPIVQESVLKEYIKNPSAGRYEPKIKTTEGIEKKPTDITLWKTESLKTHNYNNHFWGLAIDLNSCTGCSACVISCQAENNVPVVGRQEVLNRREMHWIRIDRYYSSDAQNQEDKSVAGLLDRERENPGENPQVVFQPVMCQHCNNAPCETVCPVLATTHSTEGLNQMTYNRCVGTRYCANNCPYKVRRFNWFSYYTNKKFADVNPTLMDDLGRMVLNPDVTVRARGVMEKCSMCVQRIQAGKLAAKIESRRPVDGEIETACSQSCPTEALVFGDMNDSESRISKLMNDENKERNYFLLEEINVKPSVSYLTKIRNV